MAGLIDTHCHLDMLDDPQEALRLGRETSMAGMITIGTRWSRIGDQQALLRHDADDLRVWATLGIHPCHVHEEALPAMDAMRAELGKDGIVGIGESGLDYLPRNPAPRADQRKYFRRHVDLARELQKPLVIHTREADEDTSAILEEETAKGAFPFLLHCFSSGDELAHTAVRVGGYVGFSGILTFPKSDRLRALAAQLPKERLLIETDSPYLAPDPHRGRKNTPAWAHRTAKVLGDSIGSDLAGTVELTHNNAVRLFGLKQDASLYPRGSW